MKKWLVSLLVVSLMAGIVGAEEQGQPRGPEGRRNGREGGEQLARPRGGPDGRKGGRKLKQGKLTEEQRAERKAAREEMRALAAKAREETDPVKKEELIGQLRTVLTEDAEKRHAEFQKGLQQAEEQVVEMRKRLDEAQANRDQEVEERLQSILSGEKPPKGEGKLFGKGKGGKPRDGGKRKPGFGLNF